MSFDIILLHVGGEKKTVTVEYVAPTLAYISIRWGQSGVYDLHLGSNTLRARSQKAQRKGKPHWSALDIDAVRIAARDYLAAKNGNPKADAEAAFQRHKANMPNPRIGKVELRPGHQHCSYCKGTALSPEKGKETIPCGRCNGVGQYIPDATFTPQTVIRPQRLVTMAEAMAAEGYEPFPSYIGDPETD